MVTTIYTCDCCGRKMEKEIYHTFLGSRNYAGEREDLTYTRHVKIKRPSGDFQAIQQGIGIDVCQECTYEILKNFKAFETKPAVRRENQEEPTERDA